MGRPPKIKQIVNAEEYNNQGTDKPEPTEPIENVPASLRPTWFPKKVKKINKKATVNDMVEEFEIKKQKLVDRYIKKIHKLMGI